MAITSLSAWATVATASLPSSVAQVRSLYSISASRLIIRFISRGTNATSPIVSRICLAHHKMLSSSNLILTKTSQNDAAIVKQANEQRIIRLSTQLRRALSLIIHCLFSIQSYLYQYTFRGDITLSYRFVWPHDEQRQLRGVKNALGDTPQHPALQAAAPMSRHSNEITGRVLLDLLHIFTDFCYANESTGNIWIKGYKRGDREIELCQVAFAQFPLYRTQVGLGLPYPLLLHLCQLAVLTILVQRRQTKHLRYMQCSLSRRRECGAQVCGRGQGRLGKGGAVERHEYPHGTYTIRMQVRRHTSIFT